MIMLPNGCYCIELSVNPKNYKQVSASIKKDWYISYRFYDPTVLDSSGKIKGYQRIIKGMNAYKTVVERRRVTIELIQIELNRLKIDGFNPITNTFRPEYDIQVGIDPYTSFSKALDIGYNKLEVEGPTLHNVKSCKKYVQLAISKMNWNDLRLSDVTRKHIKAILDMCNLSPQSYNHYRNYLMMLLKAIDYFDVNPAQGVPKKELPVKIRPVMIKEYRKKVEDHYKEKDPVFLRFLHLFFHSGGREIEMLRIKKEDVDLINRRFIVTIKKGKKHRQVYRPIKDAAYGEWVKIYNEAKPGDYIFGGLNFSPSQKQCRRDYLTKKWLKEVKRGLEIKIDLYTLKHANLDETAEILSINDASRMAGHTTPVITLTYAQGEKERELNRLRKVNNPFA